MKAEATGKARKQVFRSSSNKGLAYSMEMAQRNPYLLIYLHGDIMILRVSVGRKIQHQCGCKRKRRTVDLMYSTDTGPGVLRF